MYVNQLAKSQQTIVKNRMKAVQKENGITGKEFETDWKENISCSRLADLDYLIKTSDIK